MNRVRVAVLGAGWYAAENHIPVLKARADVELDGVCRLGAAELARVRDHFGFAFGSENFREVIARKPQAVVVASPHYLHYEHARAAIEAGAHVLCEKPMTVDPGEAWDLVARARKAGVQLLIANGHHWLKGVADLRAVLAQGAVGKIEHVMCSFVSVTRDVFLGERGLSRWATTFFRPDIATWQTPTQGGGFAYGQMSHSIAIALWLTGLAPRSVSGHVLAPQGNDLCDAAAVLCETGAVISLSGAAAMPEGGRPLMRLIITGDEGVMDIDLDRDFAQVRRHDGKNRRFEVPPGQWAYNCLGPPNALIDLAQGRGENLAPGEIGAAATAVIAAILKSARGGGAAVDVEGTAT